MEHHYNLQCIAPMKKKVVLPSINLPIEIPVNPLLGCIFSLLSNQNVMLSSNLIFSNINNPAETVQYNGIYS